MGYQYQKCPLFRISYNNQEMPVKSIKRILPVHQQSSYFQVCDVLMILALILILGTMGKGVYQQVTHDQSKLHEQSILCIKDFDSSGCNPFNMSSACNQKLECIKHGDGLSITDIIDIANKHVRNNGAIPIFIVMLVVVNEIRRRYYNT